MTNHVAELRVPEILVKPAESGGDSRGHVFAERNSGPTSLNVLSVIATWSVCDCTNSVDSVRALDLDLVFLILEKDNEDGLVRVLLILSMVAVGLRVELVVKEGVVLGPLDDDGTSFLNLLPK